MYEYLNKESKPKVNKESRRIAEKTKFFLWILYSGSNDTTEYVTQTDKTPLAKDIYNHHTPEI